MKVHVRQFGTQIQKMHNVTKENTMTQLNVHFVNRGYGTDDGVKTVELVKLGWWG
jgi:hypothetical protein